MVGFAGSADLYAVHNVPLSASSSIVFSFSLLFRSFNYRKLGSVRCNSFVLNVHTCCPASTTASSTGVTRSTRNNAPDCKPTLARPLRIALTLPTTTHQHSTVYGLCGIDLDTHVQHKQLQHLKRIARLWRHNSDHPSPALYRTLTTDKQMINDHHSLMAGRRAGTTPTALYLAIAFFHHVLPPPAPAAEAAHGFVMQRHPSPSAYQQRMKAADVCSTPQSTNNPRPRGNYRQHVRQFESVLLSTLEPGFHHTMLTIRRKAAYVRWLETHDTPETRAALSATRLSHCTSAPIVHCIVMEDATSTASSTPLLFAQNRHRRATTSYSDLTLRARLLANRAYTAAVRFRFRSRAGIPTLDALCPHPACNIAGLDETVNHLLLDCPYYAAARQQLLVTLTRHGYPLTLRYILNPPDNKGKAAYAVVYTATAAYLASIVDTRRQHGLPALDYRPTQPLPAPPPAGQHASNPVLGQVVVVGRPSAAPAELDTG